MNETFKFLKENIQNIVYLSPSLISPKSYKGNIPIFKKLKDM